eukprot:COSAG02_NODE_3054_length_7458_cov_5.759750_8_plen_79_part_00
MFLIALEQAGRQAGSEQAGRLEAESTEAGDRRRREWGLTGAHRSGAWWPDSLWCAGEGSDLGSGAGRFVLLRLGGLGG